MKKRVIQVLAITILFMMMWIGSDNISVETATEPKLTAGVSDILYDVDINETTDIINNDVDIVSQGQSDVEYLDGGLYPLYKPSIPGGRFEDPVDNEDGFDVLYAMCRVNLRSEPNTTSEIIGTLNTGDMIAIHGRIGNDTWCWSINPDTGERVYIDGVFLCWEEPEAMEYTQEDLELMAHLIYSENGILGEQCMFYTGSVVLNRVASNRFPDTIYDVIYQDGQYEVTWTGAINKTPSDEAYYIAENLMKYGSVLPPSVIWQAEFMQGDGLYVQIGPTKFCYSNNY